MDRRPHGQRNADGYAADLTEAVTAGPLAGIFDEGVFPGASVDGKVVLVPHTADVTNVLWYNEEILEANGLTPPTTWEELLAACDVLNEAGVIPIASGNKDLWAAGNWLSHIASRVVGEDVYAATLSGEGTFSTPEWEQAFGYVEELADHKCVNESANAVDDNAGAQLFFQGEAAMHPIGSWLVSWAIDENPDLRLRLRQPARDARGLGRRPGQRHRCGDRLHGQRQQREHRPGHRVPGAGEQPARTSRRSSRCRSSPRLPTLGLGRRHGRSIGSA